MTGCMRWLAFLILSCLAACAPGPESAHSVHTGVERHASAISRLDLQPGASFDGRAAMVRLGGMERWVILTSVIRRDGDTPRISAAWSFGQRLDYRRLDRRLRSCDLWSVTCAYEEKGEIRLSRDGFSRAVRSGGLTVYLSGYRGVYEGHIPASAFEEVLRRAGASCTASTDQDSSELYPMTPCG